MPEEDDHNEEEENHDENSYSYWCDSCQMYTHISDDNPWGTCLCS